MVPSGQKPFAILALVLSVLIGGGSAMRAADARETTVLVFAAASLKTALDGAAAAWNRDTGKTVKIAYGGSSALARHIQQGAPADVFLSANTLWMDFLVERDLIDATTRIDLFGNRLVLIAPQNSPTVIEIRPGFDLAGALGGGRLAMANANAVPAGIYGKSALIALGVWEQVRNRTAEAQDVRAALILVSHGEAPLGIAYSTDAAADPGVRVVATFPEDTHAPIVYPAALIADGANPAAASFRTISGRRKRADFSRPRGLHS